MAKSRIDTDLFNRLRASGVRKRVATKVAETVGTTRRGKSPKHVSQLVDRLRGVAAELEDRAKGGPSKRKAAAKKAAATRRRVAAKRSAAAKKAAKTRARARSK